MFIQVKPIYFFLTVPLNTIIQFGIFALCLLKTAPYIMRNSSFQVCDIREGDWAEKVRIRLSDPCTASDLYAAYARYHNVCRLKFMAGRNVYMQAEKQAIKIWLAWMKPTKSLKVFQIMIEKAYGHRLKSKRFIKSIEALDNQGSV